MCCCCCCCKHSFFAIFLKQFFSVGNSAGSIIQEAVSLIRLFQRLSATKSFSAKFSKDCLDMFKWAANLVEYFTSYVRTTPLSDYELFTLYTFIFPLSILIFISSSISAKHLIFGILLCGSFIMLGSGLGYLKVDKDWAFLLGAPAAIIILIILIVKLCKCCIKLCQKREIRIKGNKKLRFTFSIVSSCAIFFFLMTPIMENRAHLTKIISIAISVLIIICLISEIWLQYSLKFLLEYVGYKLLPFFINCFSMLIIPSTESFVNIIQGNYKGLWQCIISYIGISLIIPVAMTLMMIITRHPDIEDKYIEPDSLFTIVAPYFELIDIVKQVVYAVVSAYDFVLGSLITEIIWVILIIIFRPYQNISDYSLTFGGSLVVIIANSAIIYANSHDSPVFSFTISLIFVIIACVPAIVSLYLYFIFDFVKNYDDDFSSSFDSDEIDDPTYKLGLVANLLTPFAFFFYATNITIITKKYYIPAE